MTRSVSPLEAPLSWALLLVAAAGCGWVGDDGAVPAQSALRQVAGVPMSNLTDACVADFDPGVDYFPDKVELRHAHGFSVTYHGSYKVLRVHPPAELGGGLDVMVLVQCGTPVPPLEGELAGAAVVEVPVRTVAANEDLTLTRVRVLGRVEQIVGMGGGGVYAPELRSLWESGSAVSIGESFHGQPYYELLLAVAPDVTFLSTAALSQAEALRRARLLGIPSAPSVSWVEPTLLAQAEWLLQVALFMNAEAEARQRLAAIEARYNEVSERVRAEAGRPLVLWIDPAAQGDRWTVPEGSWKAQAVVDAGGRSAFGRPGGPPTREVTTEELLALGDSIDLVITESVALDEPGSAGALEGLRAFREGRVYNVHRRSRPENDAYDWYETAVVEVDLVLSDLVALLHPTILSDHPLHHVQPKREPRQPSVGAP